MLWELRQIEIIKLPPTPGPGPAPSKCSATSGIAVLSFLFKRAWLGPTAAPLRLQCLPPERSSFRPPGCSGEIGFPERPPGLPRGPIRPSSLSPHRPSTRLRSGLGAGEGRDFGRSLLGPAHRPSLAASIRPLRHGMSDSGWGTRHGSKVTGQAYGLRGGCRQGPRTGMGTLRQPQRPAGGAARTAEPGGGRGPSGEGRDRETLWRRRRRAHSAHPPRPPPPGQ